MCEQSFEEKFRQLYESKGFKSRNEISQLSKKIYENEKQLKEGYLYDSYLSHLVTDPIRNPRQKKLEDLAEVFARKTYIKKYRTPDIDEDKMKPIRAQELKELKDFFEEAQKPEEKSPLSDKKERIYVERSPLEKNVCEAIKKDGAFLRIKGLKHTGKTMLLEKIIMPEAKEQQYITVRLDLGVLNTSHLTNMDIFLKWFCNQIEKQLKKINLLNDSVVKWDENDCPNNNATDYLEEVIKTIKAKPLVIALEDIDHVFEHLDIANDLCALLRRWVDEPKRCNRNSNLWKQLRLVILHSTEVYAKLNIYSSPLSGIGSVFKLDDFERNQVNEFIKQYKLNWSDSDLDKLVQLVGGNPYLIDRACQEFNLQNITPNELLEQASKEGGIYSNELREHLTNLNKQPQLKAEFRKVIMSDVAVDSVKLTPHSIFQLQSMGLIKLEGDRVSPRCELYRNYFSRIESL